jgi:Spy/CpxP family protein refolding chaperone
MRLFLLTACLCMAATMAHAQRGGGAPGGGGPGGGGPGGGGPGGGGLGGGGFGGPGGGAGGMIGAPRGNMGERGPMATHMPPRTGLALGLPGRWWDDSRTVRQLNLRSDQQKKMDRVFDANRDQLLDRFTTLQREESRLSSMSAKDLQDQGKVFAQIDRVAGARAELEKENAYILMQIRQQLDADQVTKLDAEIANLH